MQNQAETTQAAPSIALKETIDEIRGLSVGDAIEKLSSAAKLGLNILNILKSRPSPQSANMFPAPAKRSIAQRVHGLSVIPGGRDFFETEYKLLRSETTIWMQEAGLLSDPEATTSSHTLASNEPEQVPTAAIGRTIPISMPQQATFVPLTAETVSHASTTLPASPHTTIVELDKSVVPKLKELPPVPQNGKNNGAPQNGNGHPPKAPAPRSVQAPPAKQTRLDKLLGTPAGAISRSPTQAIKDVLLNETPIEIPHADILKKVGMIIDNDPEMAKMWVRVSKYAANPDINMLIRGESGSGKELVPLAIHRLGFADAKFVIINCGALPEQLIESELFGHEKGSFTGADKQHIGAFEEAKNGVIVLDEIGDLNLHLQVKLLRAIENKEIRRIGGTGDISVGNIKIVATTNRKIPTMVEMGSFRHDLYLRIAGADIHLPPLRDRTMEHKTALVAHFIKIIAEAKKIDLTVDENAMHAMASVKYIGNVREMKALIEKVYEEAKSRNATATHIELMDVLEAGQSSPSASNFEESSQSDEATHGQKKFFYNGAFSTYKDLRDPDQTHMTVDLSLIQGDPLDKRKGRLGDMVSTFEKVAVFDALKRFEGNQSKVATHLGITRGKVREIIAGRGLHSVGPTMAEYLGEMKFTLDE